MLEIARILALFSVVALVAGILAWVKLFQRPALQRLDGRSGKKPWRAETASQLVVVSVGMSAVAAVLAVAGWIF
jgi:hypothetical protein